MADEKILIIEDESAILELLQMNLEMNGFSEILTASNGEIGLQIALAELPDLILLDLMLPGMDGLEVCRKLKAAPETTRIPVLMLTAKSEESDIVAGLEMGACDYVTKPFSNKILISRIRAQLRQNRAVPAQFQAFNFGELSISPVERKAFLNQELLILTYTEFEILLLFCRAPGKVFTRFQIISQIKGNDYPVTERSVDVQIVSLRRKLGAWGNEFIETVRGVGYRLKMEEQG